MNPADEALYDFLLNAGIGVIMVFVLIITTVLYYKSTTQAGNNLKAVVELAQGLVVSQQDTTTQVTKVAGDVQVIASKVRELDVDAEQSRASMRQAVLALSQGMKTLMTATTAISNSVTQNPVQHTTLLTAIQANGESIQAMAGVVRQAIAEPLGEAIQQLTQLACNMASTEDLNKVLDTLVSIQGRLTTLEARVINSPEYPSQEVGSESLQDVS